MSFFCFYKCKVAILKKNTFGEGVKIRHVQSYLKLSKKDWVHISKYKNNRKWTPRKIETKNYKSTQNLTTDAE